MRRKIIVSTLILLYSASAIGLPLHFHYCKGELKHVTLLVKIGCHEQEQEHADHACCKSHLAHCLVNPTMDSCCDDATEWIQDNIPAIVIKGAVYDLNPFAIAEVQSTLKISDIETNQDVLCHTTEPPTGPPIYLLTCSLIYYG